MRKTIISCVAAGAVLAALAGCSAADPTPVPGSARPVESDEQGISIPVPDGSWLDDEVTGGPATCSTWHTAAFRAIADTEPAAARAYAAWASLVYAASNLVTPAPADLAGRITAYCEDPHVTVAEHDRRQGLPLVLVVRQVATS